MTTILQDIRYAIRVMLRNPGFSATAVFALGIGIGTITQVFSVVNRVLIEPLPYKNSEELVMIWQNNLKIGLPRMGVSGGDFTYWKEQSNAFDKIAAVNFWGVNITGAGEPERVQGFQVSASLFPLLAVKPMLGRTFLDEEDQPGKDRVVIVSHGLWERHFGSNPNIVGQTVTLNNNAYTIIGVMPPEFQYPRRSASIWVPLALDAKQVNDHASHFLWVIGRMKPGVSFELAQAEMISLNAQVQQQYPETNTGYGVWLLPLRELIVGPARQDILITLAAAIFVLLISIANVASMLLARAAARHKEIAIRVALGASRWRLIRQLVTESLVLSAVGALFGIFVAYLGVKFHAANIPDFIAETNPAIKDIHINGPVLVFTLLIAIVTGIIFGLVPSLTSLKVDLNKSLKEGGRASSGGSRHWVRSGLVVFETAMAMMLLTGAGLLVKSYLQLQKVDPGFNPANILTMDVSLLQSRYSEGQKVAAFYRQVVEKIRTLPGVKDAGAASNIPMGGTGMSKTYTVEGMPPTSRGEELYSNYRIVSPHYFSTLGLPLQKGRDFTESDVEGTPSAIISETLARNYWPAEDPVGKHLTIEDETMPREIIGVVGDVKDWDLANRLDAYIYVPYLLQKPRLFMTLVVRTNSDPMNFASAVRSQVLDVDNNQPVYNIRTMEKIVADTRWPQRINMGSLAVLAAISLILAAVGIYGLISYTVNQRTHELGLRMAIGAQQSDILKLVVREGMVLGLIGLAIGLGGALWLTRLMSSLLFGVSATDPFIFVGVSLLLAAIALLSSFIPARRASKVNPMVALRHE